MNGLPGAVTVRIAGPVVVAATAIAMVAWAWGGWADPLVDFGRELYIPWQLSLGKVLYRDIAHLNGPLSAYTNALLFKVFGVSLRTLVLANLSIAAGVTVMIWALFRAAGGRASATVACLSFVSLFLTGQFVDVANYNWICPYSHEITHGIALSLLAMLCVTSFAVRRDIRLIWVSGIALGMTFLTKVEVFVAAAPVVTGGMLLALRSRGKRSLSLSREPYSRLRAPRCSPSSWQQRFSLPSCQSPMRSAVPSEDGFTSWIRASGPYSSTGGSRSGR